jgi:selenocysteine lyase/cysteine desulfurase
VTRSAKGLARKPRALESLLWRRLGAEPWLGGGEAAAKVALKELVRLYEGPLRSPSKARAMENALAVMARGATGTGG